MVHKSIPGSCAPSAPVWCSPPRPVWVLQHVDCKGPLHELGPVLFCAGNGALPISPAWSFTAKLGLTTNSFPEVFPTAFAYGPINAPLVSDGRGHRAAGVGT